MACRPRLCGDFDRRPRPTTRGDGPALLDGLPWRRPRFVTLYFDDVDTAATSSGRTPRGEPPPPTWTPVIGRLLDGLKSAGITGQP
jgi:hypothetical protein